MSTRAKWVGVALVLLGVTIGAQYVWGGRVVGDHGANSLTVATTISPDELTKKAGSLPDTVIGSYF